MRRGDRVAEGGEGLHADSTPPLKPPHHRHARANTRKHTHTHNDTRPHQTISYALPEFPRDDAGRLGLPGAPSAYFPRLPPRRVLTVNLEVPEAWLVEATRAAHDLDNLRLVRGGEGW